MILYHGSNMAIDQIEIHERNYVPIFFWFGSSTKIP